MNYETKLIVITSNVNITAIGSFTNVLRFAFIHFELHKDDDKLRSLENNTQHANTQQHRRM